MQNKDSTRKRITITLLFITELLTEHNLRLNLKETVKKIGPKVFQNHLNLFSEFISIVLLQFNSLV